MHIARATCRTAVVTLLGTVLLIGCKATDDEGRPRIYPALSEPEHKPVFHNDRIDVYQVRLKEGAGSYYHLHSHDQLGITMRSFVSANQVFGRDEQLVSSEGGSVSYIPHTALGGTTHRVRAIKGEMWVIGIEFPEPAPPGTKMITAPPSQERLEFPQGKVTRIAIAPGQTLKIDGELLVAMTSGALTTPHSASWSFESGNLQWVDNGSGTYKNEGTSPVELLALALK